MLHSEANRCLNTLSGAGKLVQKNAFFQSPDWADQLVVSIITITADDAGGNFSK